MSLGFKLFTKKCEKNAEKVSSPPPIEIKRRKEKKRPLSPRRKNIYSKISSLLFGRKKKKRRSLLRVAREKTSSSNVWSEDASAEKADRGEKFVGFDREVRRYLFHTCASETECD